MPGRPEAFLSSISHDDAATAVVAALGDCRRAPTTWPTTSRCCRRDAASVIASGLGVAPPRPLPGWVAKLAGSLGELMSRSVRISNRKLRTASGWAPRWPSLREGWPAMMQAMKADAHRDGGRHSDALGGPRGV